LILGLYDSKRRVFDRKAVVVTPVSPELPRPYHHEKIVLDLVVDQDLVLGIHAKAATRLPEETVREELIDIRYAVSLAGIGDNE
jgi:hypothetical protein